MIKKLLTGALSLLCIGGYAQLPSEENVRAGAAFQALKNEPYKSMKIVQSTIMDATDILTIDQQSELIDNIETNLQVPEFAVIRFSVRSLDISRPDKIRLIRRMRQALSIYWRGDITDTQRINLSEFIGRLSRLHPDQFGEGMTIDEVIGSLHTPTPTITPTPTVTEIQTATPTETPSQ